MPDIEDIKPVKVDPTLKQKIFVEDFDDTVVCFQIVFFGRQWYCRISAQTSKLNNLHLSIPTPFDNVPSSICILNGSSSAESKSLSQRLAQKLRCPVLVSVVLPNDQPMLKALCERRLVQELKLMQEQIQSEDLQQQKE
uniref:Uncharacterized protein n=1 Tax=Polytomella parva TaxID=51329 RepID=A0A7S0YDG9_9CHLO